MSSDKEDNDSRSRLEDVSRRIDELQGSKKNTPGKRSGINGEKVFAELIAGIVFGLFVGYFLDDYFDTKPLFIITLVILGLAGSFYNIYKVAVKDENTNKDNENV